MLNTTPARPTAPTPTAALSLCPDRRRDRYTAGLPAARPAAVTLQDHVAFLLGRDDDGPASRYARTEA